MGSAALATTLATAASAQSPSWPAGRHPRPCCRLKVPLRHRPKWLRISRPPVLGRCSRQWRSIPTICWPRSWLQYPQNAALNGDQLSAALQQKSSDPSVKSLALFPRILRILDANSVGPSSLAKRTSPLRPLLWTPSSGFAVGLNRLDGWSRRRKRSCARNRSLRVSKARLRSRPRVERSPTLLSRGFLCARAGAWQAF
jgi:hypothetical protein